MVCCFGLGGGLCVVLSSRHRRDAPPTPSTRRASRSGTRATRGGGGGPSVKTFAFDSVFDQHSAQEDVFAEVPPGSGFGSILAVFTEFQQG